MPDSGGLLLQVSSHLQAGQADSQTFDNPHASTFSEYGWPPILALDNGPYYNATELKQVMEDMDMHHNTSSSHCHQFNGMAEKMYIL